MPFQIITAEDEQLFRLYANYRDDVRNVMGNGVYPNLKKAIATYDAFDAAFTGPLADENLIAYHTSLMTPVAPYIAQLRADAEQIVAIMEAIEEAVPTTFGIPLPQILVVSKQSVSTEKDAK